MRTLSSLFVLVTAFCLSGCDQAYSPVVLPNTSGGPSRLVIVSSTTIDTIPDRDGGTVIYVILKDNETGQEYITAIGFASRIAIAPIPKSN